MPRTRVRSIPDFKEVIYDEQHWRLLENLRKKAIEIMKIFTGKGITAWLHGSVARGDVSDKSDVDIVIPHKIQPYIIETIIDYAGLKPYARYIVAATPTTTLKAYIALDEEERFTISFPLVEYKPREIEFYKYGGILTYEELLENKRVPGVNKNLVLIVPTSRGHLEAPVIGYEDYVARFLNVNVEVVRERVEVLTRRNHVGRTGVFAKIILAPSESFEEGLERLLREKPLLKRILLDLI
ncbi:MAG: nucleotidyltransferase domain-containing protein [Desulfurococcaceae archaeon]